MKNSVLLFICGVWIGLVLGISFIEAPLKFQAPGITTALGLGIGKLVFGMLNKVELVLAAAAVFVLYRLAPNTRKAVLAWAVLVAFILGLQSLWLLPVLGYRVELILANQTPPATYHHVAYVGLEVLKLCCLSVIFIKSQKI